MPELTAAQQHLLGYITETAKARAMDPLAVHRDFLRGRVEPTPQERADYDAVAGALASQRAEVSQ